MVGLPGGLLLVLGLGVAGVFYLDQSPTPSPTVTKLQTEQRPPTLLSKEKSSPGFTLFGESGTALIRLVNMSGETVKSWPFDSARTRLLPNCNFLVVHGTKWGWSTEKWKALRPFVREYTFDGKLIWERLIENRNKTKLYEV